MFCPHCGAEIPDGAKFCMSCGQPIAASTPEPVVEQPAPFSPEPVVEQPEVAPTYETTGSFAPVAEVSPEPQPVVVEPVSVPTQPETPSYVPSDVDSVTVEPIFPDETPSSEAYQPTTISAPYETPEPASVDATMVRPQAVETPQQSYHPAATSFPQASSTNDQSYYSGQTQPQYGQPQQPQYGQQPTYGQPQQPQYGQQPTYGQPQQPQYGQQPTYGQPQQPATAKKGPLQSPIVKILAGIAAFAVVFFIVSGAMRGCSSDPEPSSGSGSGSGSINITVPDTPEPDSTDEPSSDSGSSTSNGGSSSGTIGGNGGSSSGTIGGGSAITDECTDANGNVTAYAVTELTGAELSQLFDQEGWSWDSDKLWFASPDRNYFYVYGFDDYEYTLDEIEALDRNSGDTPTCSVIVVKAAPYSSAEDCFNQLTPMVVEDVQWLSDDLGMAVVYGPSMTENVILISYNEDEDRYVLDIFNEAAVEQGLIDEWLGDNYGHSIDDLWNELFDKSPSA